MKRDGSSRRTFLKTAAVASAGMGGVTHLKQDEAKSQDDVAPKSKVQIKVAGYHYDRVEALMDGRVTVDNCEVAFEKARIGEMNTHVFSGPRTREVTEIGLLPFILAKANEGFNDYSLIPVFPLRLFRHKSIFIRNDRGISAPQDLKGKRVATPGYSSTSLTWIRGILEEEYGVRPEDIEWVVSSKDSSSESSGSPSKQENVLPEGITVRSGPAGKDESDLLVDGDVDALFHAAEPRAYREGHPKVKRLFEQSRNVERAYYSKTGIFPIMHAVALRSDFVAKHPWLPQAVFLAYSKAKEQMYIQKKQMAWFTDSLPWIGQEAEETRKLMGDNFWPYGIEANRKALETLIKYSYEQGLAKRKLELRDLFIASTFKLSDSRP